VAQGKAARQESHWWSWRLTEALMGILQNYHGQAIRSCVGDVEKMMKAVQAIVAPHKIH